jgi:hypothetical protein
VRMSALAVAMLGVLSPVALVAQAPDFESRLDAATRAAVEATLEAAARDSLPVHALESKVLEGVAKGRPAEQIGSVVAGMAQEFRSVRAMLRDGFPGRPLSDGEVVAAALATRQGIAPEVVRSLWAARPDGESLEVPVTVLSDLVRRGVPVDDASAVMTYVVRAAVPLQVAAQIPGRVDGALVSGSAPSAALVQALRALHIPTPPGRGPGR